MHSRAGEPHLDLRLRGEVVAICRALAQGGLTHGTSGNVSVRRDAASLFISPTGMAYATLEEADIPLLTMEGRWFGRRLPSSEWRFHRDIMAARSEVNAIVHTHSPQATALACNGRGIPPFHYMVAVAGGNDIRCAPYHRFGSQELSDAAVAALDGRNACLLANHGVIALGATAQAALKLAAEVEALAVQYIAALTIGDVQLLDDARMLEAVNQFRTYGRQDSPDPGLTFGGADLTDT
jgi:L-fuculose-phosphate aldolase